MVKFFANLNLVVLVGVVVAVAIMLGLDYDSFNGAAACIKSTFVWLHVFFGILWIGLLYYLNFVQVPTMPAILPNKRVRSPATSLQRCSSTSAMQRCLRSSPG